jgi:inactivated superfamily I helicase
VAGTCTVCSHEARDRIDEALVAGTPYRDIVKRNGGVSISSLSRHRQAHLSVALVALAAETDARQSETLLEQLRGLYRRVGAILETAERDGRPGVALQAIKEARSILETVARVTGELDERPVTVVNLHQSPEWQALSVRIVKALEPYPEARYAVAAAIARPELTP